MRRSFGAVLCLAGLIFLASPAAGWPAKKPPRTYAIPLPAKPDFSPLEWLVGEWQGKTTAKSPQGEVALSVEYDLDQRFLILREKVMLAATATAPSVSESWLGILSGQRPGGDYVLRVFSSTGFITRYRVTVDKAVIRFTPEGGEQPPPGWLFRRVVTRTSPAELTETVEAAPPGGDFFDYYAATLSQKAPAEKPAVKPAEKPAEKTAGPPAEKPQ
jgi:hypothetical protein